VSLCDLETLKEEAKACERAVNTNPQWVVTPREKKNSKRQLVFQDLMGKILYYKK
jgi:hypothetical protein